MQSQSSTLFLIENSFAMATEWSDLREECLDPLLRDLEKANMKVLAVESLPVPSYTDRDGGHHGGLDSIRFNGSPSNRLSTAKVNAAIDLLVDSTPPFGEKRQNHLVLVAASCPIDNPLMGIRQYAWFLLAEKLQKSNISCHLVLARNGEDMSSLIGLYEKSRWLQGAVDIHPPNEGGRYLLKFAARSRNQGSDYEDMKPSKPKYSCFPLHLPIELPDDEDEYQSAQLGQVFNKTFWKPDSNASMDQLFFTHPGSVPSSTHWQQFPSYN